MSGAGRQSLWSPSSTCRAVIAGARPVRLSSSLASDRAEVKPHQNSHQTRGADEPGIGRPGFGGFPAFRHVARTVNFSRKPGLAEWLARMAAAGFVPADPGLLQIVKAALPAPV